MIINMHNHVDEILQKTLKTSKDYNVILANGLFPFQLGLKKLLKHAPKLICCDGAADKLLERKIMPSFVIGDCDSLSNKAKTILGGNVIKMDGQDESDLSKAIKLFKSLHIEDLVILGATGLREDHTTANIALLAQYTKDIGPIYMISDYGIFTAHDTNVELETLIGQQISFFTLDPNTQITCPELKWPLDKHKFQTLNGGTLNQAIADKINLTISSGQVIVYRSFEVRK